MDKEAYRVAYLIAGYIRNTLTQAEHEELDDWVNDSDRNMKLFEDLTDEKNIEANLAMLDKTRTEQVFKELQQTGRFEKSQKKNHKLVWMTAAAAAVLLCFFSIRYLTGISPSINAEPETADNNWLQPGSSKATLTLPDGRIIDLAKATEGTISNGQGVSISKINEHTLAYHDNNSPAENSMQDIHILTTPIGGQFQLTLHDNTKVWLNAGSVLRYPAAFSGNERKVELTGEAYFEVSPGTQTSFKVVLGDNDTVTVLGTRFNVQAYPEEEEKRVTLIAGKVLVQNDGYAAMLTPGMQAVIQSDSISIADNTDIEEVIDWKNGLFVFHDASIEDIMDEVARWYNARIIYNGNVHHLFNATIKRNEPLDKLLHLLQLNGYVNFKTENNTIYVYP